MNDNKKHYYKRKNKKTSVQLNAGEKKVGKKQYPLKTTRYYLSQLDQNILREATMMAEDPTTPNRFALYTIYKEVCRDLHLKSQMHTAQIKVLMEPWAIVDWTKKAIDVEKTRLLKKQWFQDLSYLEGASEWWGHSAIEFMPMVPASEMDKKLIQWDFKEVKIIEREHIRPETGELLPHPDASKGISYRETSGLKEWILEAGSSTDLGLLQDLARAYIYKKFTMGDWSESSEKWTDPILIIQTASDNDRENDKKMDWATNIGKNRVALLDDQDKINMLESKATSGNAHKIYLDFISLLNEEMSKGVNGQSGTSDEKAFVGSAEVHERLLNDYTLYRLRRLTFFHNDKTIPFLISKGFPLQNCGWVPMRFFNEFIGKYTIPDADKEEKDEKKKLKPTATGGPTNSGKKPFSGAKITALHSNIKEAYTCICGSNHYPLNEDYTAGIDIDVIVDRSIKRIYANKGKNGQVDSEIINATKQSWLSAISEETGNADDMEFGSKSHNILLQMRHNAAVTAVFKNYANQQEILSHLFNADGSLRTFAQFSKAVKPLVENFNKNYLLTEYNLAKASARAAVKWQEYEKRGGKIKYLTQLDGRVRDVHSLLHGTTLAVEHVFWNDHYPPLDYGCRCYTRWASEETPSVDPKGYPEIKPMFRGNVGKTGIIFNESNPYHQFVQGSKNLTNFFGQKLPIGPEKIANNSSLYQELIKSENHTLIFVDNLNGGFVFSENGLSDIEMKDVLSSASILAGRGEAVVLKRPIVVAGVKNADMLVNGVPVELKTNYEGTYASIDKSIRTASKQADVVLLNIESDINTERLEAAIYNRVRQADNITQIGLVYNGEFYNLSREEIINRTWIGKIK